VEHHHEASNFNPIFFAVADSLEDIQEAIDSRNVMEAVVLYGKDHLSAMR
jgi:hypothetical protein